MRDRLLRLHDDIDRPIRVFRFVPDGAARFAAVVVHVRISTHPVKNAWAGASARRALPDHRFPLPGLLSLLHEIEQRL